MRDLFDLPPVPGLATRADFVSISAEADLIERIEAENLSPFRFQQWTGKRKTQSFGWSYDFESGRFAPTKPLPDWLEGLRMRVSAFAGLAPDDLVQAMLTRYDPGAGIRWHKDRSVFEHVVGISLGSAATFRLRRRTATGFDRARIELQPRSIYNLKGEVRHDWEHSIAAMARPRWSITFRSLSAKGGRD